MRERPRRRTPRVHVRARARAAVLLAAAALLADAGAAAGAGGSGIYSCVDAQGRRLTADRPIPECLAREQQVLNRDGSVRGVQPPTLTADERARKEARERAEAEAQAARREAVRRDRNLLSRYADEAAHQRAREGALDTVRLAMKATDTRLRELAAERKPLLQEMEFYKGRSLPPKLKASLDANDAARDAQRAASQTQQAELARINRRYDAELDRLRRLWAGAAPGSMGSLDATAATAGAP